MADAHTHTHERPHRHSHYEAEMLSVEDARERILSFFNVLPSEEQPLLETLGQTLDEDLAAEFDIPPADNSAMDGYAVRSADLPGAAGESPVELRV
ncbi:MAG: molybdopterin molybdenumtransferase MoeA, partial [Chloroflexota bacterium]